MRTLILLIAAVTFVLAENTSEDIKSWHNQYMTLKAQLGDDKVYVLDRCEFIHDQVDALAASNTGTQAEIDALV